MQSSTNGDAIIRSLICAHAVICELTPVGWSSLSPLAASSWEGRNVADPRDQVADRQERLHGVGDVAGRVERTDVFGQVAGERGAER